MKSIKILGVTITVLVAAFCIGLGLSVGVMAQEAAPGAEKEKEDFFGEDVAGWRIRDFKPYVTAIHDLQKLNKEYSDNLLKLAIDEYSTGLDILEDMENDIVKIKQANKERKHLNERFYWQEIDRRNQEQRQIYYKKQEAKMKAVTYLTKSINYLDQIQNSEVKQEPRFLNFQSRLFQVYVSTQYDLHNFMPCIPILERYVTLSDANAKDVWAYKYMASCYGYMERILGKYRHAGEDEINRYKNKKNRSMLTAVELTYGVDSPHYKHIQEIVEQDEKRSERINDFK